MIQFPSESRLATGTLYREISVGDWRVACLFRKPLGRGVPTSGAALRLAEDLIRASLGIANHEVRVATLLPSGRPIATIVDGGPCPTVSVSHVRDVFGAAISFDGQVGIDIVCPDDVTPALMAFLTPQERAALPEVPGRLHGFLWAAKEAAYKAARRDVEFHPLRVHVWDLSPRGFRWSLLEPDNRVDGVGRIVMVEEHIVAIAAARMAGNHDVEARSLVQSLEGVAVCS